MKFTDKEVKGLKARTKKYKLADEGCPGLTLVIYPTGRKTWFIRQVMVGVSSPGEKTRPMYAIGCFGTKAGELNVTRARAKFHSISQGVVSDFEEIVKARRTNSKLTIADVLERYAEEMAVSEGHRRKVVRVAKSWTRVRMGNVEVGRISKTDVRITFGEMRKIWKKTTQGCYLRLASQALKWAMRYDLVPQVPDHFKGLLEFEHKTLKTPPKVFHILTDAELRYMWEFDAVGWNAKKKLEAKYVSRLLIMTGLRGSEILRMRWDHIGRKTETVDGVKIPVWVVPATMTKTAVDYLIPLMPPIQELLKEYRALTRNPGQLVFPFMGTCCPNALTQMVRKTHKLPHTVHDIRKTVATRLGEQGFVDAEIDRILNHGSVGVIGHYNHATHLRIKLKLYEAWLRELSAVLGGQTNPSVPGEIVEAESMPLLLSA